MRGTLQSGTGFNSAPFVEEPDLTPDVLAMLAAYGTDTAMYDMTNPANLFQDTAGTIPVTSPLDPIGRVVDLTGNGFHQLQATATARPLWNDGAHFDGIDDLMSATVSMVANGFTYYFAASTKVMSWPTGATKIYGVIGAYQSGTRTLNCRIGGGGITENSGVQTIGRDDNNLIPTSPIVGIVGIGNVALNSNVVHESMMTGSEVLVSLRGVDSTASYTGTRTSTYNRLAFNHSSSSVSGALLERIQRKNVFIRTSGVIAAADRNLIRRWLKQ